MTAQQTKLNDHIIASTLLDNWGGLAILKKESSEYPVGISEVTGELVGYNDGFINSGFMYVSNILHPDALGVYNEEVTIHILTRKEEGTAKNYQVAIDLHSYLFRRKYTVDFVFVQNDNCEFCNYITLKVLLKSYATC
jgi:hypothetical protein